MENDDFINTIDEFRTEIRFHFVHHCRLYRCIVTPRHLLDHLRSQVGSHDDHRILEIHGASLPVGHAPIVEHLQEHVEYIRMRFFDFIEQNHAVGFSAHRFGQIAAFFITHIAGRRADQAGDRMLFHKFAHVDADQMFLGIEQESGQRLAQFGFTNARRPQEKERSIRFVRVGKPRT